MNLIELQQYTISEEKAEEYLQAQSILEKFDKCPHCESPPPQSLSEARRGKRFIPPVLPF
jgi:hypothetical protein